MTTSAQWNTTGGNWFTAANWDEPNPDAPPPTLHYVPGADNTVNIPDNSLNSTPFTVTYNGTSSIYSLTGANNVTVDVTGGSLTILHGGFGIGRINVATGATLRVDDATTNFWFSSGNLSGTLSGDGVLRFVNGTFNLNAGLSVTVDNWVLSYQLGSGSVSTTELNTNLTYAKNFQLLDVAGNYPILNLNGNTLTLSGTALLDGQVNEAGTVRVTGSGSVAGGYFADGAKLQVSGTLQQTGSYGLGNGTLQIDAGATYTIVNASNIDIRFSGTSTIRNNGTLSDTAAGISRINGDLTNNGTITLAAGANLALQNGTHILNGTIQGAGTLTFGFAQQATLNTTTLTVAAIYINGGNAGGTLSLGKDITYANSFTLDDQFGNLDLNGHTLTLSGTANLASGSIDGTGTLRVTGTATLGTIAIGDVAGGTLGSVANLRNSGTVTQNGAISVHGAIINDAGRTYTLVATNIFENVSGTFSNAGTLSVTRTPSATNSTIYTDLTNTGTIAIANGAALRLDGTSTLGGTVTGAGSLTLAGTATINTAITTSSLALAGTASLGVNLTYGGAFSIGTFSATNLAGHTLTLSGTAALNTGFNTINGGTLRVTGSATIGGVGLGTSGSATTLVNAGTITQVDQINLFGTIENQAGRTYTLGSANIVGGPNGSFTNAGTLAVNAVASFTGDINTGFTNTGTVTIGTGATLRLSGTSTVGGTVGGAGTLVLAGTATVTGAITTGALAFNGTTTLGNNLTYAGAFSNGTFSTINLNGRTLTLNGSANLAGGFANVSGAGTIVLNGSSTIGGISLGNTAPAMTLRNAGTMEQVGGIGLNGSLINVAGATILMSAASNITNLGNSGGSVTNNGTFTKNGDAGTGTISALFTNNGLVRVLQGTLDFQDFVHVGVIQGAVDQAGARTIVSADAAGELTLTGGTGNNRIVVTNAPTSVTGGGGTDTLVIAANMTIAAGSTIDVERIEVANGVTANLSALSGGETFVVASIAGGGSTVIATQGADTITSGAGNDSLRGQGGNDTYVVNNAGDGVVEAAGGGTADRVNASVSYVLAAGQQVEILGTTSVAGTAAINLTGNELAQTLYGNAGINTLNGGGGADILQGFGGNDTYVVDNAGDQVLEASGGGTDRVNASVSYVLAAGQEIETLGTTSVAGTAAINLTGNALPNTLIGNAGANVLSGGAGADTLQGYGGNDTYVVDNAADQVLEAAGGGTADRVNASTSYALAANQEVEILGTTSAAGTTPINLTGNAFNQTVYGNAGINVLNGHAGTDTLSGFAGNDTFSFTTGLGAGNVDHVTDFSAPADTIRLAKTIFSVLSVGTLAPGAYKDIGDPGAAVDADDRILYDDDTGALFYDANGSVDGGRFQFAILDNKPATLTAADFVVVA